ncbi:hypothetical protein [Nannocystis pusilla]|uniref:hypothetical protein n=1 Tax=Nannocystis pusilla TaxID=889268 RepID=UPI003DA223F4
MIRKATKDGAKVKPGVVTFAGTNKAKSRSGDTKITTTFVADIPSINTRADLIVDAVTHALLVYFRQAIQSGSKPDGSGEQVRLSQAAAANPKRLGPVRGFDTGHMSDNLRRTPITGTTTNARARVLPPTDRNVFIGTEAKRGIFYLSTGGEVETLIQQTLQRWLDGALGNNLRDADAATKTASEADR